MSFTLLANISPLSIVDLGFFFNILRVSAHFGCCHGGQPSRPYLCPYRDTCVPIIAVPRCLTVRVASHHFPPTTSGNCSHQPAFSISRPLRMSRLFPLLLGRFLSTLLLTILYYGVLCKLLGQFNGSLPQSIAVGCTHNCGHDQHLDLFTGSSLSEIEIEYLY